MKKISLLKFEIISSIFVSILGTLLHFTYKWSNKNPFIGIFSATNESTWEHLKLIFFPMLITTILGTIYYKNKIPNYLCTKTKSIIISLIFITTFFYTSTGIIGKNISFFNIASFFIAIILSEYYFIKKIKSNTKCNNLFASIILTTLFLCFIIFSIYQPQIGIFKEPPYYIFIK